MFRSTILAVGIFASSSAPGANWRVFAECGQVGQQRVYSYDVGSVQRHGDNVAVPLKADYSRVPGSRASMARIQWALDCHRKSFVEKSRLEYGGNGRIVATYRTTRSMDVNPGSVADKLFQLICV
jgi:hypothetical protein